MFHFIIIIVERIEQPSGSNKYVVCYEIQRRAAGQIPHAIMTDLPKIGKTVLLCAECEVSLCVFSLEMITVSRTITKK